MYFYRVECTATACCGVDDIAVKSHWYNRAAEMNERQLTECIYRLDQKCKPAYLCTNFDCKFPIVYVPKLMKID